MTCQLIVVVLLLADTPVRTFFLHLNTSVNAINGRAYNLYLYIFITSSFKEFFIGIKTIYKNIEKTDVIKKEMSIHNLIRFHEF